MEKCDVYLENYRDYYVAGQEIIGHLQVTLTSPKSIKGVKLKLKGEAKTEWTERESHYNSARKKNETRSVNYHGHETYFSTELNLLRSNSEEITLSEGVHKYPFTYRLPTNLPSSFTGSNGYVKYIVKGVVNRTLFDYEAKSPFNVVSLIDLNLQTHLRDAQHITKQKNLCCLWMKSGPISFELNVPFTGFSVGQDVPLNLFIENFANASVDRVEFEIKQTVTFITTTPSHHTKTDDTIIVSKEVTGVGAHGDRIYEETLKIPETFSAPNLDFCTIINIAYTLKIKAHLPCPHKNITAKIPVVIGHIPLIGTVTNVTDASAPPTYGFVSTQLPYNPDVMPLPSGSAAPVPGFVIPPTAPNQRTTRENYQPQASAIPINRSLDDDEFEDWVDVGSTSADAKATAPPPSYEEAVGMRK